MFRKINNISALFIILCLVACSKQPIERPDNWAKKVSSIHFENLYKVSDSLYRSEQPNKKGFEELQKLGVASVLNLRTSDSDTEPAEKTTLQLFSVEMKAENIDYDKVLEALKIIKKAPKPILVHCKHGSDRTGLIVAMYRIIFEGWNKESAIKELKEGDYGFHSIFVNIPKFIENADIEQIKKAIK